MKAHAIRFRSLIWCSECPFYITTSRASVRSHLRMKHGVGRPYPSWKRASA